MIIGLGTSGPQVIEHFHGVAFNPPLTRMREYVDIINLLMAGQPLNYDGKLLQTQARVHAALRAAAQAHPDLRSRRSIRRASSSPRKRPTDGCR